MKIKRFIAAITMVCTLMSTNVFAGDFQEAAQETKKKSEHLIVTDSHVYTDYTKAWGIKKITFTPAVTKVDEACLYDYHNIEEVVWNASVSTIPEAAFASCSKIKKVTISPNVTVIGNAAFRHNESLKEITLPKNLKEIGARAFWGCTQLKKLYIPESVVQIGVNAFDDCKNLTVYGKKNSFADYYCQMKKIPFKAQGQATQSAVNRAYIKEVSFRLKNNTVYTKIELDHKVKGASGYQYQILDHTGDKVLASRNTKYTVCTIKKAPYDRGIARVRSWKNVNGKRVYGKWSNEMKIVPKYKKEDDIKIRKATGRTGSITVQVDKLRYSEGYDLVAIWDFHSQGIDNYGKYVLKNQHRNTATISHIMDPGTYIVKAHAFSRINGVKVFGAWSPEIRVVVK